VYQRIGLGVGKGSGGEQRAEEQRKERALGQPAHGDQVEGGGGRDGVVLMTT
jgi:hypothetical protein